MTALSLCLTAFIGVAAPQGPAAEKAASPSGPWIGTWKRVASTAGGTLDPAVFTMWLEGDGFRYTYESTPASGPAVRMEAFGRFDGQPWPEKGNPMADHNVFTRVDDRTYALVDLKDGKETIRFTIRISPDGKTRTSESRRRDAQGKEIVTTTTWERLK